MLGGRSLLVLAVLCHGLAGCSCGALVLDRSRADHDGGGAPPKRGTGGTPSAVDSGAGGLAVDSGAGRFAVDAGEDVIGPRSGAVIEVSGFAADGYAAVVRTVRDRTHGVECTPTAARDGTTRCFPGGVYAVRYTDATCQTPVVLGRPSGSACDSPSKYAIENLTLQCPAQGSAIFAIGSPVAAPATSYYMSVFGCVAVTTPPGDGEQYFAATASPPGDWVSFEHHVKNVTSRLGVGYWLGSDGSRLIDSAWLLEDNEACRQEFDTTGNSRCIPSVRSQLDPSYFTDDTCGTKVALTTLCNPPSLVEIPPPPDPNPPPFPFTCTTTQTIYGTLATATRVPSDLVYSTANGGACSPTKYGGFEYYAANSPVRFADYPSLEIVHEGPGRLQPAFWASEGKRLYAEGLYDTAFGDGCGPATTTGSETVCQTNYSNGSTGQYFADPKCTVSLYAAYDAPGCPTTVPQIVMGDTGPDVATCEQAAYAVRHVLGVHVGPIYTSGGFLGPFPLNPDGGFFDGFPPSGCSLVTSSSPSPVTYDLGPVIPAAQALAPLTSTDF